MHQQHEVRLEAACIPERPQQLLTLSHQRLATRKVVANPDRNGEVGLEEGRLPQVPQLAHEGHRFLKGDNAARNVDVWKQQAIETQRRRQSHVCRRRTRKGEGLGKRIYAVSRSPSSPASSPAHRNAVMRSAAGAASTSGCVRNVSNHARPSALVLRKRQNPPSLAANCRPVALSPWSRSQVRAARRLALHCLETGQLCSQHRRQVRTPRLGHRHEVVSVMPADRVDLALLVELLHQTRDTQDSEPHTGIQPAPDWPR